MQTSHKFTKKVNIWFVKPICFVNPKLYFATPDGVATHSLRSPGLHLPNPKKSMKLEYNKNFILITAKITDQIQA